jgi:hypothetical protein
MMARGAKGGGLVVAMTALASCGQSSAPCPNCRSGPSATIAATTTQPITTCPPCRASASALPPAVTAPSAIASATPREPQSDDEDLYCHKSTTPAFGNWTATPADVRAALEKVRFVCAPPSWLAEAVSLCIERMGQIEVGVRYGVMDGDHATPNACDIAVGTAEWNGRKWITLENGVREGGAMFGYTSSMEMTKGGPIVSTNGCAQDNGKVSGSFPPLEPPGWKTFPDELKTRICR